MTAHRFFLPSVDADRLTIEGDDARHAVRVLRIRPGETITVSDGAGAIASATVVSADDSLIAQVTGRTLAPAPRPALTVYQSIPKHGKLHDVVDALTQIGVAEIVPMHAQRSVPRWDARKAGATIARLRRVALEASMQSRRARLPRIGDVGSIDTVPAGTIVLHEEAPARLHDALSAGAPEQVGLAVGPEGGFDPGEIALLAERGCAIASLGPLVVRSELAALVAATAVLARYGVLG